jgi:alkylation response protein AidB-like acyl-CoA dehydrogenase
VKRGLYLEDHEAFRGVMRNFVEREVAPHVEAWDDQGLIGRNVWHAAGEHGILGLTASREYGGAGMLHDYRFRNVVQEELNWVFASSLNSGFSLQDDIAIPYIEALGTADQCNRWLPGMIAGDLIGAIAMSEPGTGSDLQGIATSAKKVDGGWLLNGSKTFITNGIQSDLIITVARTDPNGGPHGFSLLVVERGMEGFARGRKLKKLGLRAQDTAELSFENVFVPNENLLGAEGAGFIQVMSLLPLERLSIAAGAIAATDAALATTLAYTQQRTAFKQPISDFQTSRFKLADMSTEADVTRAFVDKAVLAYNEGDLTTIDASKAKLWATEVQNRVVDECLQMHGGYGYMLEYPISRAFQDARVQKIYGGTNEIMRHIIGRDLVGRR